VSLESPSRDDVTDVIAVVDQSSPVFVDASGRRGRRIRIVFSMLGAATLVYGALVATSLVGGPLEPQQLLPFPDLVNNLPVLDPQPTAPKPGAKNTPGENRPVVSSARKINSAGPSAAPVASGEPTATTAPAVEATSAAPTPSADPTKSPTATPRPSTTQPATPTPGQTQTQPGTIGETAGTALSGETASAVSVGAAATALLSALPLGAAVTHGATASLGAA
jgi:hypothetical protein